MKVKDFVKMMMPDVMIQENGINLTQEEYVKYYGEDTVIGFWFVECNVIGLYCKKENNKENNMELNEILEFIVNNYGSNIQVFNTRNTTGDKIVTVYNKNGVVIDYCEGYYYLEVFGLLPEEFQKLQELLENYEDKTFGAYIDDTFMPENFTEHLGLFLSGKKLTDEQRQETIKFLQEVYDVAIHYIIRNR